MRSLVVLCVVVAGCAVPQNKPTPLRPGEIVSAQAASSAMTIGKNTKADVRAALGQATVIDFESGYEVWVYRERVREKATPPATELVLLFSPSGVLAKTRVR